MSDDVCVRERLLLVRFVCVQRILAFVLHLFSLLLCSVRVIVTKTYLAPDFYT